MALKQIALPDLGEGVTEGEILKIKVKEGDRISLDQALLEVMTDKASMEIPSSIEGVIEKIAVSEGDIVPVGSDLFTVQTKEPKASPPSKTESLKDKRGNSKRTVPEKEKIQIDSTSIKTEKSVPLAIPASRKLAEELEIDLTEVRGSGEQGEIKRKDLLNYIKKKMKSLPDPSFSSPFEETKRVSLKGIQRLMFESMTLSKATIPHFTIGEQVRVDHLVKLRAEMKDRLEKQGLKNRLPAFFYESFSPCSQRISSF